MSADVSERLAEGETALGTLETYLAACRALGRPVGGVTAAGVRDAYTAEAGMRLRALDADSAALAELARAAEEGVRIEREALGVLAHAWQGESGDAAGEFVGRHCAAGAAVAVGLQDAARALRSLRSELGGLVDEKVGAAVDVDSRRSAQHPAWLAEARTVLEGVADKVAVEVVARQIGPYVDGDIAADLMPAMQAGTDSVAAAYDAALARLSARSDLDSAWGEPARPPTDPGPRQPLAPAASAQSNPPPAFPTWSAPAPSAPWSATFPGGFQAGLPDPGAAGGLGGLGGFGGFGGSLSSLVGRIADELGGYAAPPAAVPGRSRTRDKEAAAKDPGEQISTEHPAAEEDLAAAEKDLVGGTPVPRPDQPPAPSSVPPDLPSVNAPAVVTPPAVSVQPPVSLAVPPLAVPGDLPATPASSAGPPIAPKRLPPTFAAEAPEPVATTAPADSHKTPCAIAADELPQVGQ